MRLYGNHVVESSAWKKLRRDEYLSADACARHTCSTETNPFVFFQNEIPNLPFMTVFMTVLLFEPAVYIVLKGTL